MTATLLVVFLAGVAVGVWLGSRLTERAIAKASAKATMKNRGGWRRDRSLLGALLRPGA